MSVPVNASTVLSKSIKKAYMDTLTTRADWGDISENCNYDVDCEDVFSDYYEALDAYDEDSDNACYFVMYATPMKSSKKTTKKLGTPVDFLEYSIVGYLNDDDERDVNVYKCKGTLWMKRISGDYIITKAKRNVTLLKDYKNQINDDETVKWLSDQITSFVDNDYDYDDDNDYEDEYSKSDSPILTVTKCPNTSNANTVTISGTVSSDGYDDANVTINGDSVEVDFGYWSKDVTLKEGENTFVIKATNRQGKTTTITKTITFYSGAPNLVIKNCPETSATKNITISGSVSDPNDSNPKVYINDDMVSLSWSNSWSKEVTLKEGQNTFVIKATNRQGKTTTITKTITFNSEAPNLIIKNCPETSATKNVTISGSVSDTNDKNPKVYINDDMLSLSWGTWSKEVTLKEGKNTFVIKATNNQGKTTAITKTITFASAAPDIVISSCPETSATKNVTISGSVSDTNDKSPKVYINDDMLSLNWSNSWSKEVTLKEGQNTFVIKAINNQGKTTTITKTITFVSAAPDIIINVCLETSATKNVTISGSVSDTNDKSPKVYINDDMLSLSWSNSWSKEVTLKEGVNTFVIKATNNQGKTTTITKTINFVIAGPDIIISQCPDTSSVNKVTISGSISDVNDSAPKVYINDTLINLSWGNTWSKEVTLQEGENKIVIKAINNQGKTTSITKTIHYTPIQQK
jgi:hypothetical protein